MRILQYVIIILNSLFLTEIVRGYTINSISEYVLIAIYFAVVVSLITTFYRKSVSSRNRNTYHKKKIIASIFLSVVVVGACKDILINNLKYTKSTIEITSTGEKNIKSASSEVWIFDIFMDGKRLEFSKIPYSDAWELRDKVLMNYKDQPSTIKIDLPIAQEIKINFLKHNWSGKVHIRDGSYEENVDLYSENGTNYIYEVKGNIAIKSAFTILIRISMAFVFFVSLIYCFFDLIEINKNYFAPIYAFLYWIIFVLTESVRLDKLSNIFMIVIIFMLSVTFSNLIIDNRWKRFMNSKKSMLGFSIITLYISFSLIFNNIFYFSGKFEATLQSICIYFLFNIWLIPLEISFLYTIDNLREKITNREVEGNLIKPYKLWIIIFSIMFISLILYLIGFNPGNLSPDSIDQWKQVIGIAHINDWHPAFHTLAMIVLSRIYKSPLTIIITQIIFSSSVVASFLVFYYKKGISYKILIITSILFSFTPNNGTSLVTMWKDIPYTISLLWLTLSFAKISCEGNKFSKKTSNLIELIVSLSFVYLFRHNGVITYALSVMVLSILSIRKKQWRVLLSLVCSLLLVAIIKGPLFSIVGVEHNPKGVKYVTPVHDIASVIYHDGNLSSQTDKFMKSVMPIEEWKRLYNPYTADPYIFDNPYNFVGKLSMLETKDVLLMYMDTFIRNPGIVAYDRLAGLNLIWDVFQPIGGYNSRFSNGVFNNDLGLKRYNNILTELFSKMLNLTSKKNIVDALLWRCGIYTNLILLIIYYLILYKIKNAFYIFIPIISNIGSLIISMSWQDYRYVYFEFFIFWFILLWVISCKSEEKIKNNEA